MITVVEKCSENLSRIQWKTYQGRYGLIAEFLATYLRPFTLFFLPYQDHSVSSTTAQKLRGRRLKICETKAYEERVVGEGTSMQTTTEVVGRDAIGANFLSLVSRFRSTSSQTLSIRSLPPVKIVRSCGFNNGWGGEP